jgi:DNA-binding response OmpR family regulator
MTRTSTPAPRHTVLLIEDDSHVRELIAHFLNRDGFEVAKATSCEEALRALANVAPDVIVTDWCFPDGEGLEFMARLHAVAGGAPIVVLSGLEHFSDQALVDEGQRLGVVEFLAKPTYSIRIVAAVRDALERT